MRLAGRTATLVLSLATPVLAAPPGPATFSIVAADPEAGEVGVAVASRFFAKPALFKLAAGFRGSFLVLLTKALSPNRSRDAMGWS